VRNFDFLHLPSIDRMRTEIAGNRRHNFLIPQNEAGRLAGAAGL
jgi:hypothetical protein